MENQIGTFLNSQDNVEKIRDRIVSILTTELSAQKKLAEKELCAKDFDIKVYIENCRPWLLVSDNPRLNPFPLINVSLSETKEDGNPGSTIDKVKYTATFYMDCYGCGNYNTENNLDDSLSAIRAWKTARIVRNILMSGFYVHLGMQGLVRRRRIPKITTIVPTNNASMAITICRIALEVEFYEDSLQGQGITLEGISFESKDNGEASLINI